MNYGEIKSRLLVFDLLQNTDGEKIEVEIDQSEENQNNLVNRWSTQYILCGEIETAHTKDSVHDIAGRDNPHIPVTQDVDLQQSDLFSSRNRSCGGMPAGTPLSNAAS